MVSEPRSFPPSTLPGHQGEELTPDCCSQDNKIPSPPGSQSETFFPRKSNISPFLILPCPTLPIPEVTVAEAKS